jgi:SAM-dependent methyltransferase
MNDAPGRHVPIDTIHAENANRLHWDEIAPVHLKSYGIDRLLAGVSCIDEIQKREFYPVAGKDLIHLQCHIGTDTLSLALDGARVTGVDFSGASIAIARELAAKMRIPAEFIEANVLDLIPQVSRKYDIVYTSKGVLCWIRDIEKWADVIASLLKDHGVFYMLESHPLSCMFDDTKEGEPRIRYSYFHRDAPLHFDDEHPDYSDSSYVPVNKTYEWIWSLSDVVGALLRRGLRLELLNEHDRAFHRALPGMSETSDGWLELPGYEGMIPFTFSLRARKEG